MMMIERVWNHLQPQMIEHIKELRDSGYLVEEISEMVANKRDWTQMPIFENYKFHYEYAQFTMLQLCNLVEMMEGSDVDFDKELRQRIADLVEMQGIFEAEYPDQQRALNYEHDSVMESGSHKDVVSV